MKRHRPAHTPPRARRVRTIAPPPLALSPLPHTFFDALPTDALILITQKLSRTPSPSPHHCPLLNLAAVSPTVRRTIATTIGTRLAFSVYGHSDWFWRWLVVAAHHLRDISLHNRSYRSAGDVRHPWATWPRRPTVQLDSFSVLTALRASAAPLSDLDVSGLQSFRRTGIMALSALLLSVRDSLRSLKLDLNHFRIAHAVSEAKLVALNRLVIVNVDHNCQLQALSILRSISCVASSDNQPTCALRELSFDACEHIPTIFYEHRAELRRLLSSLHYFRIDYDDERQNFSALSSRVLENLRAITTLPSLQRLCLSGSGIPVTHTLIRQIRDSCRTLSDLRLIDCDIDPSERPGSPALTKTCNHTLACTGPVLTHYYPRWVTFNISQLQALATHCNRITHLRIFTGPGAEHALQNLSRSLCHSLTDVEVYPKTHEMKRELACCIVNFVKALQNLERVCLVTLDLSAPQLRSVLEHCGHKLRVFAFSPPSDRSADAEQTACSISELFLFAATRTPNLQKIECIFQNDSPPVIKSADIARRLQVAVAFLQTKATRLEAGNMISLVKQMIPENMLWNSFTG